MNNVKAVGLLILFFLIGSLQQTVFSQVVSGKLLKWDISDTDPDYEMAIISSMINIGGYEELCVVMCNKSSEQIYFEVTLDVFDYCGQSKRYNFKKTVKANATICTSPWYEGFSFETPCKQTKKFEALNNGKTRVSSVQLKVDKIIKGTKKPNTGGNPNSGNGNNSGGNGNGNGSGSGSSPGNNNNGSNTSANCLAQNISISNGPAMNCIQLRWMKPQATIQFNEKTNEIKTNNMNLAEDFVVYYRKLTDINWKTNNITGYQMGYNLKMLDPCTKYEVKIQRSCGNGNYSDFSNTITFSTTCPVPNTVKAERITKTSALINCLYSPGVNVCSVSPRNIVVQIEYTTTGSTWQTVYSNMGTGGSTLYNLQPNTSYRARVRFDYGNSIFSPYSNEVAFKTAQ